MGWEQPPGTDPRLLGPSGPALAILRPLEVLGDGARWIWELAAEHFGPARTEVVDYWHATQHLWVLGRALHGQSEPHTRTSWVKRVEAMPWGGAERLLPHLARTRAPCAAAADVLRIERGYCTTNCARMDYPSFRAQGLPIGSGASSPPPSTLSKFA